MKLFKTDTDWQNNACITKDDWYVYVLGYKKAADLLVEDVKMTAQAQDILVYPIVFLYRQYLELTLKLLIEITFKLADESHMKIPKKHDLSLLWNLFYSKIKKIDSSINGVDISLIKEVIPQFEEVDRSSMAFRYPIDNKGNAHLSELNYINLRHLADIMSNFHKIVEGFISKLSADLDIKREVDSYYASFENKSRLKT